MAQSPPESPAPGPAHRGPGARPPEVGPAAAARGSECAEARHGVVAAGDAAAGGALHGEVDPGGVVRHAGEDARQAAAATLRAVRHHAHQPRRAALGPVACYSCLRV